MAPVLVCSTSPRLKNVKKKEKKHNGEAKKEISSKKLYVRKYEVFIHQ